MGEPVVCIAAARVEPQCPVVMNPGREPKHRGARLRSQLLGVGKQPRACLPAGEWLLNI